MPVIVSAITPFQTSDENTAVIVRKLRQDGIENPEQYLTKYFVVPRDEDEQIRVYDVVVFLPPAEEPISKQKFPPYIADAIAKAIRESFVGEDFDYIHAVHFARYSHTSKSVSTVRTDAPRPLPPGLNHCRQFERDIIIHYDGLRFRSQAEIAIYKELRQRNVLFFPNALAVRASGNFGQAWGFREFVRKPGKSTAIHGI